MFFEKIIPHSFFFSPIYYTFIGVSDLCFASEFMQACTKILKHNKSLSHSFLVIHFLNTYSHGQTD